MTENRETGLTINGKNLSFIISLFTITGIIFGVVSTFNSYAYKTDKNTQDIQTLSSEMVKLTDQLGNLNTQLNNLNVTLGRLEERLNARLR